MSLDKDKVSVGMRVQDTWGEPGTVRWVGTFKSGPSGVFCGVEFDEAKPITAVRTDGTLNGTTYFSCPAGTGEFIKPKHLEREVITKALAEMQVAFPAVSRTVLFKFLLARKCNVAAATQMLHKHFQWREVVKPNMHEALPKSLGVEYPIGWFGTDKEGNLIHVERPGNGGGSDPKAITRRYGVDKLVRWHITMMETVQLRLEHIKAKRSTIIVDLTNLGSVGTKTIEYAKQIAAIDQDNYPENIARLFLINAPTMFTAVWAIVKNFLDARTREKIFLFGTSGYRDTLLQYISEDFLPTCAGGKNDRWLENGGCVGTVEGDPVTVAVLAMDSVVPGAETTDDSDDKPILPETASGELTPVIPTSPNDASPPPEPNDYEKN